MGRNIIAHGGAPGIAKHIKYLVKSKPYRLLLQCMLTNKVHHAAVGEIAAKKIPVFLDARKKEEYFVSHLENAIHVGFKNFSLKKMQLADKDTEIVVYCSIGFRSERVAFKLQEAGYTNVSNLYGGIFEWVNQGYPVYNALGKTQEVHAFNKLWGQWLRKGKKIF